MAQCNIQTLLASANCFQCLTPKERDLIRLVLICRISTGNTMPCNIETLLSEANCFQCLPDGQRQLVELALLCTLATGGGVGGGGQIYQGRDPAPPDDPTKAALSYPSGGGAATEWDIPSQTWV